jgi:hypothetical protein
MGIEWSGGEKRWDGYAAFITRINAPFDPDGGSGGAIYLNGSAPDMNGDTFNIASGTTSPDAVTTAATDADSGHGAIAIVSVSWDDISLTPSITSGWTLLGTYADPTTTYAGLVAGRIFDAGDTGTYTFNATFSSSVLSETVIDTYQSALTGGVHISQRF